LGNNQAKKQLKPTQVRVANKMKNQLQEPLLKEAFVLATQTMVERVSQF